MLRELGHSVELTMAWSGKPADILVALHARRSAAAVREFASAHPDRPVVVALTGTDLYADLPDSAEAQETVRAAAALVVLQDKAYDVLPAAVHPRVHVVHQSAVMPARRPHARGHLEVVLLAHLRAVKDPFLVVAALDLLGSQCPIRVTHLGAPLDDGTAERATQAMQRDPRYHWRGDVPREEALQVLADSDLLLLTSRLEGGANAISEAIAAGVPVLSTRIDGSLGLLGSDYPALVDVGDATALAAMLERVATEKPFHAELTRHVVARGPLVSPQRERQAWVDLLASVAP